MPVSVNKNSSGGSKPPAPPAVPVTTGDFTINTASLKSALLAAGANVTGAVVTVEYPDSGEVATVVYP